MLTDLGFKRTLQNPWQRKTVLVWERPAGFGLEKPEGRPPPEMGEQIVGTTSLEGVVVGECVVDPPHPCGDVVGQQYVDCVVTSCKQKENHTKHGRKEGSPVKEDEPSGRVLLDGEVAEGQGHCVAGEDVVTAEHVLSIDRQPTARDECEHPLDIHQRRCLVRRSLWHAGVAHVGFGQDGDAHGDCAVEVEEATDEADPSEDYCPV